MNADGLLLLNKPAGFTSHDVVQAIKRRIKATKAGHLGTLDPLATGLFPVCLGKATRLSHFYMKADKTYLASVRFGFFTVTDDREGRPEGPVTKVEFSREELEEMVAGFKGEYLQKAPAYSAKKIGGRKAYELARSGQKVELPVQPVKIHDIRLLDFHNDTAILTVFCSSGTYIRSIARDLGTKLHCGAHVNELQRTTFGPFRLDQACTPDAGTTTMLKSFVRLELMLSDIPQVVLDPDQSKRILSGSAVEIPEMAGNDWVRAFEGEKLLAFGQIEMADAVSRFQPRIVFH